MNHRVFFTAGYSRALEFAAKELEVRGIEVTNVPSVSVTHLLLPVPCKMDRAELCTILESLPRNITVLGGNIERPEFSGYTCRDLLKDEVYLAQNAQITAYCALNIAAGLLPVTWAHCPVLIVGWGRIGKALGRLLQSLGAEVSIAARKEKDRALIAAFGNDAEDIYKLDYILGRYRIIFNTVPFPILSEQQLSHCRPGCVKIELASAPGMEGSDIIDARGLPGKFAPESSGKLIARSVLRLCAQKEGSA